ncbi:PPP4R2-domain-containing protein [Phycomyces nitens]|nr:PPP4R2-domain-containing protein [Phycomyces nitens]
MENTTGPDSKSNIETLKTTIVHSIDQHLGAPFTIQRLCELLLEPRKHYKMFIKYLRAIEKVLLVTSTWEEFAENVVDTKDKPDATFPAQYIPTGLDLEPINFDNSQPEAQEKVLKKEQAEGMEDRPVKEKTASDTDKTPLSKDGKVDTPKDPSIPMNTEEHEKDKEVAIAEANPDQKSDAQACTFEAPSAMDCDISLESPAKKEVSALQDEVETTDGSAGMDMDE